MSQPQCIRSLDGFAFTWPDSPCTITLSRIRDSSKGTTGELVAQYLNGTGKAKTLIHQTLNLLSSKTRLANELTRRHEAPWDSMLEQVCVLTLRQIRAGEPLESLEPTEDDHPAWFVLNPLLYDKNPTILYGPGDSMKSFLALWCGMLLASGCSGAHLSAAPTPWKILFLDWEMAAQDVRSRVKMLRAGDARLSGAPTYRRCYQPLADDVNELKKIVSEEAVDVLIIDSLAMAAGGQELERADSAIRFNAALRSLNCTSLIVGHTPKPQEDQKERHLYGSVFFQNLCRVSWEVRREGSTMGLYQKKNNLGPKHAPLGFTLAVDEYQGLATVTEADLMEEPSLASGLPLQDQLAHELRERPGQTVKALAQALNAKEATLRTKLNNTKLNATQKRFISVEGKWECLA